MGKRAARAKRLDKVNATPSAKTLLKAVKEKPPKRLTKPSKKALKLCSATDSEDILHEMLAAAATGGGRYWKKKQKLLDKKEGLRRASATANRAASMTMNRRAALAVAEGLAGGSMNAEPFERCFWKGKDDNGGDPSQALKHLRKELGIRVVPGPPGCPPPVAPTLAQDALLPQPFKHFFAHAKLGDKPTTVQRQAWPALLNGRDLLCVSPTGSGKTLAYLLPLIPHVLAQRRPLVGEGPLALILVPTRELAQQVKRAAAPLRALCGLRVASVSGGLLRHEREAQVCDLLENTNHIVVGTPGRLADLATSSCGGDGDGDGKPTKLAVLPLRRVTFFVLDECDRMLAQGFEKHLKAIAAQLHPQRQTACFSATFPQALRTAADELLLHRPVILRVAAATLKSSAASTAASGEGGARAVVKKAAAAAAGGGGGQLVELSRDSHSCDGVDPLDDGDLDHHTEDGAEESGGSSEEEEGEVAGEEEGALGARGGGSAVAMSSTIEHLVVVVPSPLDKADALMDHLEKVLLSSPPSTANAEKDKKKKKSAPPRVLVFCNKTATVDALVAFLRGKHRVATTQRGEGDEANSKEGEEEGGSSDPPAKRLKEAAVCSNSSATTYGNGVVSKVTLAAQAVSAAAEASTEAAKALAAAAEKRKEAAEVHGNLVLRERAARKTRKSGGPPEDSTDNADDDAGVALALALAAAKTAKDSATEHERRLQEVSGKAAAKANHMVLDAAKAEKRRAVLMGKRKRSRGGGDAGQGDLLPGEGGGGDGGWWTMRVGALHGKLRQKQREDTLADFTRGKLQVLVATDLAGRGLHVTGLDHVVNFELPCEGRVGEQYPHRVGRTGRAGRRGVALTLLSVDKPPLAGDAAVASGAGEGAVHELTADGGGAVRELRDLFKAGQVSCGPLEQLAEQLVEEEENDELNNQSSSGDEDGGGEEDDGDDDDDSDEDDEDEDNDEENGAGELSHSFGESRGGGSMQGKQQEKEWSRSDFADDLWEFYEEHCPAKLENVQSLADKYFEVPGPATFLQALRLKYADTQVRGKK